MIRNRVSAIMILAFASMPFHQASGHPPVHKTEMKCYQSYANSDREVCEVSLYALIADPARHEGVTIEITGYMRRVDDTIILYPSRDAYVFSAGRNGVELLVGSPDEIEIMRGKQELKDPTTVIGKFTAGIRGGMRRSVGAITGDITVFAEEQPSVPPSLPPAKTKGPLG